MNGPFWAKYSKGQLFEQLSESVHRAVARAGDANHLRLYSIRLVFDTVGGVAFDMQGYPSYLKSPPSILDSDKMWVKANTDAIRAALSLAANTLRVSVQNVELKVEVDRDGMMCWSTRRFPNNHRIPFVERYMRAGR